MSVASCLRPKTTKRLGSSVTHAAGHPGGPRTDLWLLLPHRGIHDSHTDMLPFLHERIALDAIHGMHPERVLVRTNDRLTVRNVRRWPGAASPDGQRDM